MNVPAKWRWAGYATLAALAVVAAREVDDAAEAGGVVDVVGPARGGMVSARAAVPRLPARAPTAATATALELPRPRDDWAPQGDPFGSNVPPPPPPLPEATAGSSTERVRPPREPANPFRYVGKWQEDGRTIVFVADRTRTYVVREPGPLNDAFNVESIGPDALALRSADRRQRIALPYRAVAAPVEAPAGDAATDTYTEESN